MNLNQIDLDNFDAVVAVTQNSINQTIATYLSQLQPQITLYYTIENGLPVQTADPSIANFIFEGTVDFAFDGNGNPIDIVILNSGLGSDTAIYNLTFSAASFQLKLGPTHLTVSQGADPWIITFQVKLQYSPSELSALPPATQNAVETVTQGLGPNVFSIQQLYFDLNNAKLDSLQNVGNMIPPMESTFKLVMQNYLASLQKSNGNLIAYWVLFFSPTHPPPAFIPTGINFCVSPYTDNNGKHSNPGMDTLNYLVTTNNRPPPPAPPDGFGFNWVNQETHQGAMAIANRLYLENLLQVIGGLLPTLSPVPYAKANDDRSAGNQDIGFNPNTATPGTRNAMIPPQDGVFLKYTYSANAYNESGHFGGASAKIDLSSFLQASYDGELVKLAGYFVVSAEGSTSDAFGNVTVVTMPQTTYAWSVDLQLEFGTANGQLNYAIKNQNFNSPPTVAPENESLWEKLLSDLGGVISSFAKNPGQIRDKLQDQVTGKIQAALQASIQSAGHFIFPGGQTFLFENPSLTPKGDLIANITYLTPNTTEKGAGA